jgi:iron complex transport system substrate-binding protein
MIRTVSMLPAATEIVGVLELLDRLVGVSHECDFPDEVNTLPRVTHCEIYGKGLTCAEIDKWVVERIRAGESLYTLNEELLRELAPNLILTQRLCDVCAPAYGSVAALAATLSSRPHVLNLEPSSVGEILENIRQVACAMGQPERAAEAISRLKQRVENVCTRVAGLDTPTVFVMEWAEPIFNAGHWTPELVRLAGGVPVLSPEGKDSVRIEWADLRAANPGVLVIACCGHNVARTMRDLPILEALPCWHELRAVKDSRVYVADGSAYFSRPGPRVVDTLELLAAALHPAECGELDPDGRLVRLAGPGTGVLS